MRRDNSYFSAVLAILIVIASWAYCYVYGFGGYKTKLVDMDKVSEEVRSAQEKLNSLGLTKTAIENDEALIDNTLVAVAEGTDTENIISEIEALAAQQSLSLPSIQISDGTAAGDETTTATTDEGTVDLGFSVTGSFEAVNSFIDSLEKDVKFMSVDSLTISNGDDGISVTIGLKAYKRPTSS